MKLLLDKYAYLDSIVHRWESKPKFIALITLIFSFAFIQKITLLPIIICISIILFYLSNLPLQFFLSRLRYPGIFIVSVVILLPFLVGKTVIFSLFIFQIKLEGLMLVILVVTRFICILTITLILFGTCPFLTTLKTLRSMGLSPIISDMMLLTYRYLEEFGDRLNRMQKALKLKGFKFNKISKRNLKVIANLMGSLLVISYDQSKLVYQAMILRGYHDRHKRRQVDTPYIDVKHWLASIVVILISVSLMIVQFFNFL